MAGDTADGVGRTIAAGEEPPELARARTAAHLLDESLRIPGTNLRVGLDPLTGVLPVSGDLVAAVGSLYIVLQGVRLGLPRDAIAKMLALTAVDTVVGSVPILGTVFDAAWKANTWNATIIAEHVERERTFGRDGERP